MVEKEIVDPIQAVATEECPDPKSVHRTTDSWTCPCVGTELRWPSLSRLVPKLIDGFKVHPMGGSERIPDVTTDKVLTILLDTGDLSISHDLDNQKNKGENVEVGVCWETHGIQDGVYEIRPTLKEALCAALLATI